MDDQDSGTEPTNTRSDDVKAMGLMLVLLTTVLPWLAGHLGRLGVSWFGSPDRVFSGIKLVFFLGTLLFLGLLAVEATIITWIFLASIFIPRDIAEKWLSSGRGGGPPDRMSAGYGRAHRSLVNLAFRWRRSKTDRLSKKDDPQ